MYHKAHMIYGCVLNKQKSDATWASDQTPKKKKKKNKLQTAFYTKLWSKNMGRN